MRAARRAPCVCGVALARGRGVSARSPAPLVPGGARQPARPRTGGAGERTDTPCPRPVEPARPACDTSAVRAIALMHGACRRSRRYIRERIGEILLLLGTQLAASYIGCRKL